MMDEGNRAVDFHAFPKIGRLSREIVITEKIDGTNAGIQIIPMSSAADIYVGRITRAGDDHFAVIAQSRSRIITPQDDNFGFARWVWDHAEELVGLGEGVHFGEWWGSGIQRGYGLTKGEKRFSLFNVSRWADDNVRPKCCHVVPEIWRGEFDTAQINHWLRCLAEEGSCAAPGFMKPEGIVVFHSASNTLFKKTIERDEEPKGFSGKHK